MSNVKVWRKRLIYAVMAGLVPAIHVFAVACFEGVDARDKRGHDETEVSALTLAALA
jgi:hypothetical protein